MPSGMHSVTPHIICAGATDALEFYKKAFGATVEHVAGLSAGRLTVEEIRDISGRFLGSDAVRAADAVPVGVGVGASPVVDHHRALEDETLALLDRLQARPSSAIPTTRVASAGLGADQQHAVQVLVR